MPWIKIRHGLERDPSVIKIAGITGLDEDTVVGKLVRLWSWADAELADGYADSVTFSWVDRHVSVTGFAAAMSEAGWLKQSESGITFPKFNRHMGKSAKLRAQAQLRMSALRKCYANVTQDASRKAQPDESKSKSNKKEDEKKEVVNTEIVDPEVINAFVAAWNELGPPFKPILRLGSRQHALAARWREQFFREHWRAALAHMVTCAFIRGQNDRRWVGTVHWFLRPDTVAKILEGTYDDPRVPDDADGWAEAWESLQSKEVPDDNDAASAG